MHATLDQHAERHGLLMVDPNAFEIERHRCGRGHRICFSNGEAITDKQLKARIKALVLPPAWSEVRICVEENGHIQATGRDEKGRLQYRYHDHWVNVRNAVKTERLLRFGRTLPKLRKRIERDIRRGGQDRVATAATAARLIDVTALRPGHEKYAEDGGRGVASLQKRNLRIVNRVATLNFIGKSNKAHRIEIRDWRLVNSLNKVRQGSGQRLFRFKGEQKKSRVLTANLLNEYLREAGHKGISAKDFRTFHGSAEALRYLAEEDSALNATSQTKRKRAVASAIRSVAELLRNTPAVARSSYVHPEIVLAYEEERLDPGLMRGRPRAGLSRTETALMRFLEETATA